MTIVPPRLLKADETYCARCCQIYLNGSVYEAHITGKMSCLPSTEGLVLKGDHWVFEGKDGTTRSRRTPAQAAFDRLMGELVRHRALKSFQSDIDKVQAALKRERDR